MTNNPTPNAPQIVPAVPTGEHVHTEYLIRIITPDGRTNDHGPYTGGLDTLAAVVGLVFRCPPGSTRTHLRRTVTTVASEWEPASAVSDGAA